MGLRRPNRGGCRLTVRRPAQPRAGGSPARRPTAGVDSAFDSGPARSTLGRRLVRQWGSWRSSGGLSTTGTTGAPCGPRCDCRRAGPGRCRAPRAGKRRTAFRRRSSPTPPPLPGAVLAVRPDAGRRFVLGSGHAHGGVSGRCGIVAAASTMTLSWLSSPPGMGAFDASIVTARTHPSPCSAMVAIWALARDRAWSRVWRWACCGTNRRLALGFVVLFLVRGGGASWPLRRRRGSGRLASPWQRPAALGLARDVAERGRRLWCPPTRANGMGKAITAGAAGDCLCGGSWPRGSGPGRGAIPGLRRARMRERPRLRA